MISETIVFSHEKMFSWNRRSSENGISQSLSCKQKDDLVENAMSAGSSLIKLIASCQMCAWRSVAFVRFATTAPQLVRRSKEEIDLVAETDRDKNANRWKCLVAEQEEQKPCHSGSSC